ncbi:HET-domain-containing protein [Xylaria scruposa]|nr:HET-domain-containing protein [Xylaria scruposa]
MRLLNVETLEIEVFYEPPKYAILSHTWDKEMTFQEWQSSSWRLRKKYKKVMNASNQAIQDGLYYIWIDTICIDKTSSAELSEAINSMFSWYENAEICYAYLSDVNFDGQGEVEESSLRASRWFTRGWTLQELIAPSELMFYSSQWKRIGTRDQLGVLVSQITKIDSRYLIRRQDIFWEEGTAVRATARIPFHHASIAKRLSWVSNRVTTRLEDIAYCLLGLFRINMPLIYGEGSNAWTRLQKELIAVSDDESVFAWVSVPRLEMLMNDNFFTTDAPEQNPTTRLDHLVRTKWKYLGGSTMFAPDPVSFYCCGDLYSHPYKSKLPYSMTNAGLCMRLPLIQVGFSHLFPVYLVPLRCKPATGHNSSDTFEAVVLKGCGFPTPDAYQRDRCRFLGSRIQIDAVHIDFNSAKEVYIEDSNTRLGLSRELVFKTSRAFLGFWIVFPRGLHPYRVSSGYWGQNRGARYAYSYRQMGIFGFNVDASQKNYLGTLMFYKNEIQIWLYLGIVLNSNGTISWTYETTTCKAIHQTCTTKEEQPTNLTVEQHNNDIPGQINVTFGVTNSSRLSNWEVKMTYITFNNDIGDNAFTKALSVPTTAETPRNK